MTKFDKDYLKLCKKILTDGVEVPNRTGVNSIKIPEYSFRFDLSREFPILQSKQTFYRQAIIEMLWIWQMQSNDVRELQKRGVHIWDEWMVDPDGIYRIYENEYNKTPYDPYREVPVVRNWLVDEDNRYGEDIPIYDINGKRMMAKSLIEGKNIYKARYFGKEYAYTIGTAYGYITNRYKHMENLINTLMNDPNDRRMVKSLWQDEYIRTAVLPSCVWSIEWDVTNGKLNLLVHQRSCDVPLGLPFNVTQYAALLMMVAQVTGLEPGVIQYSIKDAHIYVNQVDGIKEQIDRWKDIEELSYKNVIDLRMKRMVLKMRLEQNITEEERKEYKKLLNMLEIVLAKDKPELVLNPLVRDFFKFDNSSELRDCKLKNYKHLGRIRYPLAQ